MAHVTAAPHPITLGGRDYLLRPLTDKDYEAINNWLRSKFIEQIRAAMPEGLTGAERSELLQATVLAARRLTFKNATDTDFELEQILVFSKMIQQGVQPEVSVDDVAEAFKSSASEADAAWAIWQEINIGRMKTQPGSPKAEADLKTRTPIRKKSTPP